MSHRREGEADSAPAASYLGFPELTIVLNSGDDDDDQIVESEAVLEDVSLSDKSTLFPRSSERAGAKQTRLRRRSMDGRVDGRGWMPAYSLKRRKGENQSASFIPRPSARLIARPIKVTDSAVMEPITPGEE